MDGNVAPAKSRKQLYEDQVALLTIFLQNGAISRAQYDKSFGDLSEKMGFSRKEQHDEKES